ncbi:hypothetical protein [Streptomyces yangpuensis]|uniref:hypothetical protein n=1 Tax=Streptomyces yangpuensis TaxID=1648182 RepID=UPI00381C5A76
MLLTWIAEMADGPLVLEPTDRRVERETNTWWLGTEDEDRRVLSVPEVVAAFEWTVESIRLRVREMDFGGMATFYVWHDEQAGQLRCSTGSVAADELPFGGAYVPTDDLGALIEGFLRDPDPGLVAWADLQAEAGRSEQTAPETEAAAPLPVWVRSIGPAAQRPDRPPTCGR